ncbi:beta-ketoacyl-[acyl-carrier-protein] synthase family protein [Streptomyces clavuligerus]|uniref:Nodulation protein E n=1 Tax=Streptomyces clavuligerus TaxID=1901 RepID=B5GRE9_STRCL|nr:beta-ketoacyl-[acyl-carrier-protein] synthase family protein [Streptomyces clavuligerus]EDY48895.1 nodulation protein E [Streptomyces clavuligerus]EFG04001.1 Type II PKS [Streptomyces clavuligerus]MBY6307508.1 beta-ketoacyl-[acyl-carrier-protein] synthase family protein [Streptomyces clavuligerus]QCS09933.1 beta-ketoacyl-[acyl-carrier-protein] synthase family protein [Streptomyces clavuligerus]QPJ98020.1 beta-ketoacyl-[acyl-carrier-protein] synthase family protein [Streptomyces clavuligerus
MKDVCVSGLGALTPLGASLEEFWSGLVEPSLKFAPPSGCPQVGVPVAEIRSSEFIAGSAVSHPALCDRSALLAVAATRSALEDAGLTTDSCDPGRVAVIVGSGAAGVATLDEEYERFYRQGQLQLSPLTVPKMMSSSAASWISMTFGFRGPAFVVASACASGTHSIGIAAQLIESGVVDVAVCGGTDSYLAEGALSAWQAIGVLSEDTCRPFAAGRTGLVLAEGAGVLVLESAEHARARGFVPRARVLGAGSSADAGHLTRPCAEGMASAMTGALRSASVSRAEIDYVNAHGTGTIANDRTETAALKTVFGVGSVPVMSSTKGTTGHALGAAGGIEALAALLALEHGVLPPTANFDAPDPACDLDCVPNTAREHRTRTVMSNSFAFGGLNASVVFGRL